jgi:hypothetical protein
MVAEGQIPLTEQDKAVQYVSHKYAIPAARLTLNTSFLLQNAATKILQDFVSRPIRFNCGLDRFVLGLTRQEVMAMRPPGAIRASVS